MINWYISDKSSVSKWCAHPSLPSFNRLHIVKAKDFFNPVTYFDGYEMSPEESQNSFHIRQQVYYIYTEFCDNFKTFISKSLN